MKKSLLAVSLAAAFGFGSNVAQAANVVTFDQDGIGGAAAVTMAALDWQVNSAVAVGSTPIGSSATFDTLMHAKLNAVIDSNGANVIDSAFIGAAPTKEITMVAGFREMVVGAAAFPGAASFVSIAGGVNFFEVYYDTAADSNGLTGAGYNNGKLILSGFVNAGGASAFLATNANAGALDQFVNNDYPGINSVSGIGSSNLITTVMFYDADFFKNIGIGASMSVNSDSTLNNVHKQADPSSCFTNAAGGTAVSSCDNIFGNVDATGLNPNVGAVNGINGPDFYLQSDVSSSFQIPEPGSLALLGLSLSALGLARRRRS